MQWQSFLQAIHKRIRSSNPNLSKVYKDRSENEVISFISSNDEVADLISAWLASQRSAKPSKSPEKAKACKDTGNNHFKKNDYVKSVISYTESARFSLTSGEDFSLAIANRSAALFHMCRYDMCLQDINMALDTMYPRKLKHKLHLRAAQCHCKLRNRKFAEEQLMEAEKLIDSDESMSKSLKDNLRKQIGVITLEMAKIPSTKMTIKESEAIIIPEKLIEFNEDFPSASTALIRSSSPSRGRFVTAMKSVKKGDILFVEKPFAVVPLNHETSEFTCGNCCGELSDVTYPCRGCTEISYCSLKCWQDSWKKYHKWECAGYDMAIWRQIGIAHLAIKVLLVSATTDDVFRFHEVQNLVTNIDKLVEDDLIVYSITAVMLAEYLNKYTDFLKSVDVQQSIIGKLKNNDSLKATKTITLNEKKAFLSSLSLRHMLQLIANGHAITRLNLTNTEKGNVVDEQQERIAVGIYPSVSMMNHSCDPTIMNTFWDDYLIVRATKDVPAGGEIFNCYGPHFRRMSFEERQRALKSQYCFQCKCPSCTDTDLQCFLVRFQAFKCPACHGPLKPKNLICLNCQKAGNINEKYITKDLNRAGELFESSQELFDVGRFGESKQKLQTCLAIRRKYLFKYHDDIAITLDSLAKVSAVMDELLDSITFLEECLAIIEAKFGTDSIEIANELNKITDICFRYLQKELNRRSDVYKNTVKKTQRFLEQAEEITNFISGPWSNVCRELREKKEELQGLFERLHI